MAVPYSGVPEVAPVATGGAPYQSTSASPESFGGPVARGQQQLGAATVQAAQGLSFVAKHWDHIAAEDASNQYEDFVTKILHGDPTKKTIGADGQETPDLGYFGLKGRAALDTREGIEKKLSDHEKAISSQLSTTGQREQFARVASNVRKSASSRISNYADTQASVYAENVNTANASLQERKIATNPDDPETVKQATEDMRGAFVKNAQLKGGGPELVAAALAAADQLALKTRVMAIGGRDPGRALALLEENKAVAGPAYATLFNHFKGEANNQEADNVVTAMTGIGIPETAKKYEPLVQQAAVKNGVPLPLAMGMLSQESQGNPNAVSPAGAAGLTQLMPGTAKDLGVKNVFDPAENVNGGVNYLGQMLKKYNGNQRLALMGYNWGPGNTDNWLKTGADPDKIPAETRNYIQKVQGYAASYGSKADVKAMTLDLMARPDLPVAVKSLAVAKLEKQSSAFEAMKAAQIKDLSNTLQATTQMMIYSPQSYKKGTLEMIANGYELAGNMAEAVNTRILAQHEDLLLTFSTSGDAAQRRIIEGLLPGHAKALAAGIIAGDEKARVDAQKQAMSEFSGVKEAVEKGGVKIDTLAPKLKTAVDLALKGGDIKTAREIVEYAEAQSAAGVVGQQTPTAMAAVINEIKSKIEGGEQDNTTIKTLDFAKDIQQKQKAAFDKDAFAAGTDLYPDVGKAAPIPWDAKPDDLMGVFAARASQARLISAKREGIPVVPFTDPEMAQLRQHLEQSPPDRQASIMSTLSLLPPDMLPGVAAALAGKNDTGDQLSRSYAAALSIYSDRDPATKPIADQVLRGAAIIKNMGDSGKKPPTTADAWQTAMQDRIGAAFIDMGAKVPPMVSDAIASVYTYQMHRAGRQGEKLDPDMLDSAITTVLGKTVSRNGQVFYPPVRGMDSYGVDAALQTLTPADLEGVKTVEGDPVTPEVIRSRGVLTNLRDGVYKVRVPDGRRGGDLADIQDPKTGRAWELDMKPLVARSKAVPSLPQGYVPGAPMTTPLGGR